MVLILIYTSKALLILKKLFYSKGAKNVPDWKTMPKLEILGVGENRAVKDKDGNDTKVFFMEEIDVFRII